jgi:Ca-activated chloride channel family protein
VTFARPDLLGLAVLLPALLLGAMLLHVRRRRRVAALLGEARLLRRLGGAELTRFPFLRLLLITAAGIALGLAAAGPQWGRQPVSAAARSLDVVLALDVSKSMLATDVSPSRIERLRVLVRRLLREMPTDRFGLVVFAGRAYVLSPVTIDHGAIELYLDALEPAIVSQGGSSLESAVVMAADLARGTGELAGERAVVLVSDGEALEDVEGIRTAAAGAGNAGVRFYTVGMATAGGAPVPELDAAGNARGYKQDERGETVISRLGDDLLRGIAERTDGQYFDGTDPGTVAGLVARLGGMERTAAGAPEQRTAPRERFASFIGLALLLLALDAWLAQRRAPVRPPRAALVAALLVALLTQGFGIGDVERGNRLYRAGRHAEAVAAYQQALADGDRSPALRYNLGTALLRLGRHREAEEHLRAALAAVDPELRERALYNLGNRFLGEGRAASGPDAERLLSAAVESYQQALRIAPQDAAAKWNLELALRERDEQRRQQPQPSESSSEQEQEENQAASGGGGAAQPQPGEGGAEDSQSAETRPLDEQQADQILNAAEQDERRLARERLRRGQRRTPVLRDW